jgi:hypothetical protein
MSQIDPFEPPAPNIPKPPAPPTPSQAPSPAPTIQPDLGEQPDIVPWGPPGSGKTTLLATMLYMLKVRLAIPDEGLHYYVYSADEDATNFERKEVQELQNGILPQPTRVGDAAVMCSRMFYVGCRDRGDGLSGRFHRLLLMDAAGEETNPNSPYDTVYWQRVRGARGVLMVINGAAPNATVTYQDGSTQQYATLVTNFLNAAINRDNFHYNPFVAVCLTQADRAYRTPEDTYQMLTPSQVQQMNQTDEPVKRFKQLIGTGIYNLFEQRLGKQNFKIFITSAAGWYRDPATGEWQPNTVQTAEGWRLRATGDNWWTVGALYPLMWLFDKIEEARYREQRKDKKLVEYYLQNRVTNQTILRERIALPAHHKYWL